MSADDNEIRAFLREMSGQMPYESRKFKGQHDRQEEATRLLALLDKPNTAAPSIRAALQAEWTEQFGDHSECPICGTACEMLFVEGN